MKKLIMYGVTLGVVLLIPMRGVDVGKLHPIELIQMDKEGDVVTLSTDADAAGSGVTVADAIENLKATTVGIAFLDTADYLLVSSAAWDEIPELAKHLKSNVRICRSDMDVDLKQASAFLGIHKPAAKLKELNDSNEVEALMIENGKMILK